MLPGGLDVPVLAEKQVTGGGVRLNAICPRCHCRDRERLVFLYLVRKTDILEAPIRVLHIAPEKRLQQILAARPRITYVSADLNSPSAAIRLDIVNVPFRNMSFEAIICNHVLEHVPDDRRAMSELLRVLKPGGWAILQVPISQTLKQTEETPSLPSAEEREQRFGQHDHVRLYARDYRDRLQSTGFSVEVYGFEEEFGGAARRRYGLAKGEYVYICTRPELPHRSCVGHAPGVSLP
jgi:SAM-dependent methyltransferase